MICLSNNTVLLRKSRNIVSTVDLLYLLNASMIDAFYLGDEK